MRTLLLCGLCLTFLDVAIAANFPSQVQDIEDKIQQEVDKISLVTYPENNDEKANENDDKTMTGTEHDDTPSESNREKNNDKPKINEKVNGESESNPEAHYDQSSAKEIADIFESDKNQDDDDDKPKAKKQDAVESENSRKANEQTSKINDIESESNRKKIDSSEKLSAKATNPKKLKNAIDDLVINAEKRQKRAKELHRCSLPLGMENGRIPDNAISASSSSRELPASRSRLNTVSIGSAGRGAWAAAKNDGKQWLKIDLGEVSRVTRVATQGRQDAAQWSTLYTLSYGMDNVHWADFKIDSAIKTFSGNTDRNTIISHSLVPYIEARFVRFNVKAYVGHTALRVELYGCSRVHSCTMPVGIEDGRVPDSAITASSFINNAFTPKHSRLNKLPTAWIPKVQNRHQYLRVDLNSEYSITRVTTQGRYNVNQYVTTYTLSYSFDGTHWVFYKQNGYAIKIFSGNNNGNTPVSHILNPRIEGRYLQINPVTWRALIAMRVELNGCPSKPGCTLPLGFEDGRIANGQLTGTSGTAIYGRLNGNKAFTAAANNGNQYLQVDFVRLVKVTGVATQGRPHATQYTKTYYVTYSVDGSHWVSVKQQTALKIFSGNNDRHTIIKHQFNPPLYARFVKLHPHTYQSHMAFRMELYGCSADDLCFQPLGIEDGRLGNQLMSASSFYNVHYKPEFGRLNNAIAGSNRGSWLAKVNNANQWLQIDFGRQNVVTKIATQGRFDGASHVKSFSISFSQDGAHWTSYRLSSGAIKVFGGNADKNTVRLNRISPSIVAKIVRIHPRSWHGHIGMRVEMYGCHFAKTCTMPLGIEDKRIPDLSMSASSENKASYGAKFGRLNIKKTSSHIGGWCARALNANQYLQIELNTPTVITKVAIQGRQDHGHWVESFKLSFSHNAQHWAEYRHGSIAVLFPGNFDQTTIQVHQLNPPIYAKYLRLRPVTWHGHICMRMEIYGCVANGIGNMAISA